MDYRESSSVEPISHEFPAIRRQVTAPEYICPQPIPWNDIHRALAAFHRDNCPDAPAPPVPLILAGWAYSSDVEKASRWQATHDWANEHAATHLIPDLNEGERYSYSSDH
jgi:hypothetical protein